MIHQSAKADFPRDEDDEGQSFGAAREKDQTPSSSKSSSDTPVLDNFGIDLTKAAEEGGLILLLAGKEKLKGLHRYCREEKRIILS